MTENVPGADRSKARDPQARPRLRDTFAQGLASTVGRRFAFATIGCSTVLALLMTFVQLIADFRSEKAVYDASLDRIKTSILPSMAESVWLLDDRLIESQLAGISQIDGVTRVQLLGAHQAFNIVSGADTNSRVIDYPILRSDAGGQAVELGTLRVSADYRHIMRDVIRRAAVVLATNILKTICVAFAILCIFQNLVGQHISKLAGFAESYDPTAQGQRLTLDPSGKMLLGGQGNEFNALERSINQWSRTAEQQIARLHNANREQAEFTYAISHDLKSPNNTMSMLIDELEHVVSDDQDGLDLVQDMKSTNGRMRQLMEGILGYSQLIEEELRFEKIPLAGLVDEILSDLAADLAQCDAVVEVGDLPERFGHRLQLRILLQNLIANAVKFRKPGVRPVVRITSEEKGDTQVVRVSDNGIGIPEEFREAVFGLFKRLHAHSEFEGSGLGLAVCRRVMDNHHGHISHGPGIDGGTTFELVFRREI